MEAPSAIDGVRLPICVPLIVGGVTIANLLAYAQHAVHDIVELLVGLWRPH